MEKNQAIIDARLLKHDFQTPEWIKEEERVVSSVLDEDLKKMWDTGMHSPFTIFGIQAVRELKIIRDKVSK